VIEDSHMHLIEVTAPRYSGPFLDGDEADWILQERERLHSLYVRGMKQLVRTYGRLGRFEDAIEAARKILAVDPFRESVHRELALLLVLNGQRAQALLHHERWCSAFKHELGIDPMPETTALIKDIRSGEIFGRIETITARYFESKVSVT
jgi:DNA-binding SARP family transcriptional activator